MALTDVAVRAAKPGEKPKKISDGGGLHLLIAPSGGKLWRLAYRFGAKQKLLALGAYPAVTLADARKARDSAKSLLAKDVDPGEQAKADRLQKRVAGANTFSAIADEMIAKRGRENLSPRTMAKTAYLFDLARPKIGQRPISEISAAEVLAVLRQIEARGTLETASRLRGQIGSLFRYAIATGRAENDPTYALRGALTRAIVKPFAAITSEGRLGSLLRAVEEFGGQPATIASLKLLALTFPRPGELRFMRWAEIDFQKATWVVPAERMKMRRPHSVPLSQQAVAVLRDMERISAGGELVLPSMHRRGQPLSNATLNSSLRRMGYPADEATSHGFRATASTLLNESGLWSADAIERQLAHVDRNEVRRAYARGEHWDERVRMMQWWADRLDALKAG